MPQFAALAVGAMVVAAQVAACGLTGGSGHTSSNGTESTYIAAYAGSVAFMQWARTGTAVQGQLVVSETSGNSMSVQGINAAFTGVVSGSSVSLTFPQGLGAVTTVTGSINGDTINLNFPQTDGSLESLTFGPGTVAEYNATVSTLQRSASEASARASAQAERRAETATAIAVAAAAASATADHIAYDVNTLLNQFQSSESDDAKLKDRLSALASEDAQVGRGLATTQSDANRTEKEANNGASNSGVCGDASGVAGDASGVSGSASGFEGDLGAMISIVAGTRQGLAYLTNDLGYVLNEIPSYAQAPSVKALIDQISSDLTSTVDQTNGYIDAVNTQVAEAFTAADAASSAGNCGPGPTSSAAIKQIT